MWISRTSLVLALIAGCNWVYGLEGTTVGADSDGDGIYDGVDNCPAIANADQLDSNTIDEGGDACAQCPSFIGIDLDADLYDDGCDRCLGPGPNGEDADGDDIDDGCDPCIAGKSTFAIDFNQNGIGDGCEVCFVSPDEAKGDVDQDGLDDACDNCLLGPPHDEDGDGIEDACDNCPLDPNPDQEGVSGTVGTACRREIVAKPDRALFDPFLVRDPFRWSGVTGAWTVADDQIAIDGMGERKVTYRIAGDFRVLLRGRLLQPDSYIEIKVETLLKTDSCKITGSTLEYSMLSMPAAPGTQPFTLELYFSSGQLMSISSCVYTQGSSPREIQGGGYSDTTRIKLRGSSAEITAFDLVSVAPSVD